MQLGFSEHEKMILHIIGARKMTIKEITEEFYNSQELPLDSRNYVAGVIRRINKKCDELKLDWTLNGKGGGRSGRTVWKAKRRKRVQDSTKGSH